MFQKKWLILFLGLCLISIAGSVWAACSSVCLDFDGDGFGRPSSLVCPNTGLDCDDSNSSITVGTDENALNANCDDLQDNDCDGLVDCDDPDCSSASNCLIVFPSCPDGSCDVGAGENCLTCFQDCSTWSNNICDEACGECPGGIHENLIECGCGNATLECGEECDDGNLIAGDGCGMDCKNETILVCVDNDDDGFYAYHAQDCPTGNDCNDFNPLVNPTAIEQCDAIDWNCDLNEVDGFTEENCDRVCGLAGFNWTGNGGSLNCCGNDLGEAAPYEITELTCDGVSDNDCDGVLDDIDSDCTGICNNTGENDWINALTPGDCNQCDFEGTQDIDIQNGEDWSMYPGMADQCDEDCGIVANTVSIADYQTIETNCNDLIDNDCDGQVDFGASCTNICQFPIVLPCVFP